MTPEDAAALRAPFPPEQIGHLPKGGVQLAFVGHAHVTDRLLEVDPSWSWSPMGVDSYGLPMLDAANNLWIHLHVAGTTTIGVGDGVSMKEKIGDAIRNAAMRRGVALDLWAKDTPVWDQPDERPVTRSKPSTPEPSHWDAPPLNDPQEAENPPSPAPGGPPATSAQIKLIHVLARGAGITDKEAIYAGVSTVVGKPVDSLKQLTKPEAGQVIESLNQRQAT